MVDIMQGYIVDYLFFFNIKLNWDFYLCFIFINFFKKIDLEIKYLFVIDIKKIILVV